MAGFSGSLRSPTRCGPKCCRRSRRCGGWGSDDCCCSRATGVRSRKRSRGRLGLDFQRRGPPGRQDPRDRRPAAPGPRRRHGRRRHQRRARARASGRGDRDGRGRHRRGHRSGARGADAGQLARRSRGHRHRPAGVPDDQAEPVVHGRLQRGRHAARGDRMAPARRGRRRSVAAGRGRDAQLLAAAPPP